MKTIMTLLLFFFYAFVANAQGELKCYDIRKGSTGSVPYLYTIFKGKLYLAIDDGIAAYELWSVDITGKVSMVSDLNKTGSGMGIVKQSNGSTSITNAFRHMAVTVNKDDGKDDMLYMISDDGTTGSELYKYDTGYTVQQLAAEILPGPNPVSVGAYPTQLVALNNRIYYSGSIGSSAKQPLCLFEYNVSTNKLRTIDSSKYPINNITAYKGKIYYNITDTVFQFNPITDSVKILFVKPVDYMHVVGDKLYISGVNLYEYNGTGLPLDRSDVCSSSGGTSPIGGHNGKVYFPCKGSTGICQPCEYDPVTKITSRLGGTGTGPHSFASCAGKLYFFAYDAMHGTELWVYDGKSVPKLEYDLNPADNQKDPMHIHLTTFGNNLYFSGSIFPYGHELNRYTPGVFPSTASRIFMNNDVSVFPNPTTEKCTVSINLAAEIQMKVSVIDAVGKIVYTQDASVYPVGQSTITIDTRAMTTGVYYIRLLSANNEMLYTTKLLKQ